nr:MAG TPA: hypothetical protein [Caudoviricetes sp.]
MLLFITRTIKLLKAFISSLFFAILQLAFSCQI